MSAGSPGLLFTWLLTHQLHVDHCTNEVSGVGQQKETQRHGRAQPIAR